MDSGSKLMSAAEAVRRFVHDGDCLALGGFSTNRRAYGLVREIIRQHKTGLCVESGAAGGDLDMLIGAGCVRAVNMSYIVRKILLVKRVIISWILKYWIITPDTGARLEIFQVVKALKHLLVWRLDCRIPFLPIWEEFRWMHCS